MSYWIVDGQKLTNEQYEDLERQKQLEKKNIQQEGERLSRQLAEAYAALKGHLERNPKASQKITDDKELEHQIYYNLRQNLQRADAAPRCAFVREDGTVCKSPQMKNDIYCYAHHRMRDARAENLWLPPLTDANAIQMAVMLVQRALIDDEISEKKAGLLLYSIQLATTNVDKTTFGESDEEMVTETQPENDLMDANNKQMEKLKRIEKVKTLSLINADDSDLKAGEKTLPRIDADDRGPEKTSPRINTDSTDQVDEQNIPLIHADNTDLRTTTAEGDSTPGSQNRAYPGTPGCATREALAPEVYANRSENTEVHANLG